MCRSKQQLHLVLPTSSHCLQAKPTQLCLRQQHPTSPSWPAWAAMPYVWSRNSLRECREQPNRCSSTENSSSNGGTADGQADRREGGESSMLADQLGMQSGSLLLRAAAQKHNVCLLHKHPPPPRQQVATGCPTTPHLLGRARPAAGSGLPPAASGWAPAALPAPCPRWRYPSRHC